MHLLQVPKPFKKESINGYIQRVALENDYENANWLYTLKGIYKDLKKSSSNEDIRFRVLSNLLNTDQDVLTNLTFINSFSSNKSNLENFRFLFKYGINHHSKYCPQCFKEENYHNKFWDLSFNINCHKHNLLLIDYCPQCQKPLSSKLQNMYTCICGFHLYHLPYIEVSNKHSYISKLIEDIFLNNASSEENILGTLAPREFSYLILFFIQQLYYDKYKENPRITSEFNKSEEYLKIIINAYEIFQSWPNCFYDFLDKFGKTKKRSDRTTGVTTYFGRFYIQLYSQFSDESYDFIRTEFELYLKKNFYKVYFNRLSNFEASNGETKSISGNEASEILKVNHDAISKLIKQEKLKGYIEDVGKQEFVSVDYKSLINFKEFRESHIGLTDAVEILGINRFPIIKLYEAGILEGFQETYTSEEKRMFYFKCNSVSSLLDKFEKQLEDIKVTSNERVIDFNTGIRSWGCKQLSVVQLVREILTGGIRPVGKKEGVGLNRFFFLKTDLDKVASIYLSSKIKREYSIKEVCHILKNDFRSIKKWVDSGFLEVQRTNAKIIRVKQEDLNLFNRNFITLPEISKRLNQNSKKTVNQIKKMGLTILCTPVKNSGGYLFFRDEIEKQFFL